MYAGRCMCGAIDCFSCGPAQGSEKCEFHGRYACWICEKAEQEEEEEAEEEVSWGEFFYETGMESMRRGAPLHGEIEGSDEDRLEDEEKDE